MSKIWSEAVKSDGSRVHFYYMSAFDIEFVLNKAYIPKKSIPNFREFSFLGASYSKGPRGCSKKNSELHSTICTLFYPFYSFFRRKKLCEE